MIAVVADDLTGAAELGGIGLAYGLSVDLTMSVNPTSTADLLVIATDARSVSESEAVGKMIQVSADLRALKPELIYKKIDSVLRGHVIAETLAQLNVLMLAKALLIPANPALGRTLVNGHYYVNGQLIHQTHFAEDPEFPVTESDVMKRFQSQVNGLRVQSYRTDFPEQGIVIGEIEKQEDLTTWASRLDDQTLLGGGSGFFTAVLEARQLRRQPMHIPVTLGKTRLYVCGSAFGESVTLVRKAAATGHSVSYMPKLLTQPTPLNERDFTDWITEITDCLQRHKQVIIAIDPTSVADISGLSIHLRTVTATVVGNVLTRVSVEELLIEGGSTASAVLQEIGVTRLVPTNELAPGVVRSAAIGKAECRPDELYVTVKPGSYHWPADLWTF